MEVNKKLIFKNIYDSGLVDVWFSGVSYSLATAGFLYMAINNYKGAAVFALISYLFTALKMVHGTHKPYEYLKSIYVYPQTNWVVSNIFYAFFLYVRLQIMFAPWQLIYWAHNGGKLPI